MSAVRAGGKRDPEHVIPGNVGGAVVGRQPQRGEQLHLYGGGQRRHHLPVTLRHPPAVRELPPLTRLTLVSGIFGVPCEGGEWGVECPWAPRVTRASTAPDDPVSAGLLFSRAGRHARGGRRDR
jgi:hypothetical protein